MFRIIQRVYSILAKDFHAARSFMIFVIAIFLLGPALQFMADGSDVQAMVLLAENLPLLNFFVLSLLVVGLIHQDPAMSVNHDWLARPIPKFDLLISKLFIIFLVTVIPTIISRTVVNLVSGSEILPAILESSIISDPTLLMFLPAIAMSAMVTNSLKSTVGIFFALVLVVSLPSIGIDRLGDNPLSRLEGIEGVGDFGGFEWLQNIPLVLILTLSATLVYYYQFKRRDSRSTWAVLAVGTPIVMLLNYPPGIMLPWSTVFGIQRTISNSPHDAGLEKSVVLDQLDACIPAATLNRSTADGISFNGSIDPGQYWVSGTFERAENGSVTFVTSVMNRADMLNQFTLSDLNKDVSVNWRIVAPKVFATISSKALGLETRIRASSAWRANLINPASNTISNHWLVNKELFDLLSNDESATLTLDYSLALLSPTSYEVSLVNSQRYYPAIAYCRARSNMLYDRIDIECFKKGPQPTLLSAELPGISASRTDSGPPNFAPSWVEYLGGKRYSWSVPSASLSTSSKVVVSAYNQERFFDKKLVSTTDFEGASNECFTIEDSRFKYDGNSTWSDTSPHVSNQIRVSDGASIEVLDWGHTGNNEEAQNIVLLAGLGASAHVYDEFALKLAQEFRVVGITRRGHQNSLSEVSGYQISRLGLDIVEAVELLDIENPWLVGHSFAGEELNYLGEHFSDRFRGLIYLDAAYDRTEFQPLTQEYAISIPPVPTPYSVELESYEAVKRYFQRIGTSSYLPEGELIASYDLSNGSSLGNSRVIQAISNSTKTPNYERIFLPALGLFAVPESEESFLEPWYDTQDPSLFEALAAQFQFEMVYKNSEIQKFDEEMQNSKSIILKDAGHALFLTNEDEVLIAISQFIQSQL